MRTTVTLGEVTEGITCCHIAAENDFVVVGSSKVSAKRADGWAGGRVVEQDRVCHQRMQRERGREGGCGL